MSLEQKYCKFLQSTPRSEAQKEEELREYNQRKELVSSLPSDGGFRLHSGFWLPEYGLLGLLSAQKHFEACPATDVFLTTFPKSGTTWILATAFAVINRRAVPHPLLTTHPHDCAVFLEGLYAAAGPRIPDLTVDRRDPMLFFSHAPFSLLPASVRTSCKIIHVARDPKDVAVSMLHFSNDIGAPACTVDDMVASFCEGRPPMGTMWEHRLEYRRESVRRPEMVLLLEYETMKAEPEVSVRRLAEFLGMPFSEEEEETGAVADIVRMCSIEFLKGLDVNKTGSVYLNVGDVSFKNSSFFRKGTVGDWKGQLTSEMARMIDDVILSKTDDLEK